MLRAEKETIVRWDGEEKLVHVYSCHPRVWRRAEARGYKPVKVHLMNGREIARQYRVPLAAFRYGFRALDAPLPPRPGWLGPKKAQKTGRKGSGGVAR
jgi:hypothetical protein